MRRKEQKRGGTRRFEVGDAVVHPAYGAGVVVEIEERCRRGSSKPHYNIVLLTRPDTNLIIPLSIAKARGVRAAISKSKLEQVWHVLNAEPQALPAQPKTRYELLWDKLHTGDILKIVEAVRDVAWREKRKGRLTERDQRVYQKGMDFLAGEVAAALGIDPKEAELRVGKRLKESLQIGEEQETGDVEERNIPASALEKTGRMGKLFVSESPVPTSLLTKDPV